MAVGMDAPEVIHNRIKIFNRNNHLTPHCCHTGTTIKHPVPDLVKPSFVIFDISSVEEQYL